MNNNLNKETKKCNKKKNYTLKLWNISFKKAEIFIFQMIVIGRIRMLLHHSAFKIISAEIWNCFTIFVLFFSFKKKVSIAKKVFESTYDLDFIQLFRTFSFSLQLVQMNKLDNTTIFFR